MNTTSHPTKLPTLRIFVYIPPYWHHKKVNLFPNVHNKAFVIHIGKNPIVRGIGRDNKLLYQNVLLIRLSSFSRCQLLLKHVMINSSSNHVM